MRARAYSYLSTRLAAAEAGAAIGKGFCPALEALTVPCPAFPLAEAIGSDVCAMADALGIGEEQLEADLFAVCGRQWRAGRVLWWHEALEAYGKAAPFGQVAAELHGERAAKAVGPWTILKEAA